MSKKPRIQMLPTYSVLVFVCVCLCMLSVDYLVKTKRFSSYHQNPIAIAVRMRVVRS